MGFLKKKIYLPKAKKDSCKNCQIKCSKYGIQIEFEEPIGGIEIFIKENKELYIPHPKNGQIIFLPTQEIIISYEVLGKFWINGQITLEKGISCPAQKHCELIECTFCLQMLLNPQCASKWWIGILVFIIYFTMGILIMACKILKFGLRGLFFIMKNKWRFLKFIGRQINRKIIKKEKTENLKTNSLLTNNVPRNNKLPKEVILLLFALFSLGRSLETINAKDEHCIVDQKEHRTCFYEDVLELNFGLQSENGQETQILLQDSGNRPTGKISLKINAIQSVCVRNAKFFTREFKLNVNSVYLCSGEGSCKNQEYCENFKDQTRISELPTGNFYPGISGCINSCKGYLFCDNCYYSSYVCLLHRCYAKPITKEIYEIFECPEFGLELKLNITLETIDKTLHSELRLIPGFTQTWNDIKLTATSITAPPIPALRRSLITDGNRYAIITKTQENFAKRIFCPNIGEAQKFGPNCKMQKETCKCQNKNKAIECAAQNGNLRKIFNGENVLPLIQNGLLIKNELNKIVVIPELTAAILQIRLSGISLKAQIELNTCKITFIVLEGCYNCKKGAFLKLKCTTDFGRTLANINCPSFQSAVICDPSTLKRTISVHLDHSIVNEQCEGFCPASTTKFKITGKLSSPEIAVDENKDRNWIKGSAVVRKIDWFAGIKELLDFPNIFTWIIYMLVGGLLYFFTPIIMTIIFSIFSYLIRSFFFGRNVGNNRCYG